MNIQDQLRILGSQTQTASTTSAPFALTPGSTVMVTNESTTILIRIALGGAAVVATAASTSIPPNSARQFSVSGDGSTFIAILAASTTASVNITTGEGCSCS